MEDHVEKSDLMPNQEYGGLILFAAAGPDSQSLPKIDFPFCLSLALAQKDGYYPSNRD